MFKFKNVTFLILGTVTSMYPMDKITQGLTGLTERLTPKARNIMKGTAAAAGLVAVTYKGYKYYKSVMQKAAESKAEANAAISNSQAVGASLSESKAIAADSTAMPAASTESVASITSAPAPSVAVPMPNIAHSATSLRSVATSSSSTTTASKAAPQPKVELTKAAPNAGFVQTAISNIESKASAPISVSSSSASAPSNSSSSSMRTVSASTISSSSSSSSATLSTTPTPALKSAPAKVSAAPKIAQDNKQLPKLSPDLKHTIRWYRYERGVTVDNLVRLFSSELGSLTTKYKLNDSQIRKLITDALDERA